MKIPIIQLSVFANQLYTVTSMEALSDSPFLHVPKCTMVSHLVSALDPTSLARLGRVSTYFHELSLNAITRSFMIPSCYGLIWDIEKVYDVYHEELDNESISGPLEQLIRKNVPKKQRDLRLEGIIQHYFLPNLFGKRFNSYLEHVSLNAAELSRMILKYKRFGGDKIHIRYSMLNEEIIHEALPYLKEVSGDDIYYLNNSPPGYCKYMYELIPIASRSRLLTYLHENAHWEVDSVRDLLPVDNAAAFYCCNMANDENAKAVEFVVSNAPPQIAECILNWITHEYHPNVIMSLLSRPINVEELTKRTIISYLAAKNHPIKAYKAVRGAQRVKFYRRVLEAIIADPSFRPARKIRPSRLLEVALMYDTNESTCRAIIDLPRFNRQLHLVHIALIKKYSNAFMRHLLTSKGPRFVRHYYFSTPDPHFFNDFPIFHSEIEPDLLVQLVRQGEPYDSAAPFYLTFYPKNSPILIDSVKSILNDLSGMKQSCIRSSLRSLWIWDHKDANEINRLIAKESFLHGAQYVLPMLKDEDIDAIYSFTNAYSTSDLVAKIKLNDVNCTILSAAFHTNTLFMLARMIFRRPCGFKMLKGRSRSLHHFYALAILHCEDRSLIDFDEMLREIRLEQRIKFWCFTFTGVYSSTPGRVDHFINHLASVCEINLSAKLILERILYALLTATDDPRKIEVVEHLNAEKWKALIFPQSRLLRLLILNVAPIMLEFFRSIGIIDHILEQIANHQHLYTFPELLASYPVFGSLSEDEKLHAGTVLRQARPERINDDIELAFDLFNNDQK